jgi:hypothetical protein
LQRAILIHGGDGFSTHHEGSARDKILLYWAWEFMWLRDAAHVAASLLLDGYPARWPRICWECDDGWGHNVGGKKLGHAPTMNGNEKHAPRPRRGRPMTLLEDLDRAAIRAMAAGFLDDAARLRAHAERLREEMVECAEAVKLEDVPLFAFSDLRLYERINGGKATR